MKNKKALVPNTLVYLILLVIFISLEFVYINNQLNGAATWSDYYAKELSGLVNQAIPGDQIEIDIHQATKIAKNNNLNSFSEIFSFNNLENQICVKLSSKKTCYFYFNEVDIIDSQISLGKPVNKLSFKVVTAQK